jgi:hypothetical protein
VRQDFSTIPYSPGRRTSTVVVRGTPGAEGGRRAKRRQGRTRQDKARQGRAGRARPRMTISRGGSLKEAVRAGGWQSGAELRKERLAEVAKLPVYQDLYRQAVQLLNLPISQSLDSQCAGIHLQVQPSEHILGLFRPSSCTLWAAVGLNVLHTALPLTCQLGVCSRALDWVCLPARRSGSPLACTCRCTAVCACVCVDVGRKVVRYSCSSMLTQCSPSAHRSLLTAHSLTAHSLTPYSSAGSRHGWNSLLQKQKLSLLRHLSERGPSSSWVGRDWGSGRAFLRLTRTSPMLVCRANPPVWSCRVERLPAMQLDGRAKWRGDGIRSLGFQPPGAAGCYWRAEVQ